MDDDNPSSDLIQQATARLRRKQLEEQLTSMMDCMAKIQVQSSYLYDQLAGVMKMTQQLKNYDDTEQQQQQMDLLENHFKLHQTMLHQWFPISVDSLIPADDDSQAMATSSSSSSLSDGSMETRKTMVLLEHQWDQLHRLQRRLRIKHHQRQHQYRQRMENSEEVLADFAIANSPPTTTIQHWKNMQSAMGMHHLPLSTHTMISPPSPTSSSLHLAAATKSMSPSCSYQLTSYQNDDPYYHLYSNQDCISYLYDTNEEKYDDDDGHSESSSSYDTNRSEYSSIKSTPSSSFTQPSSFLCGTPKDSHDTLFDDTMAFLDQMALEHNPDNALEDDYFFDDMVFLLDHPELCHQPLADLAPLLEHQRISQANEMKSGDLSSESSPPYIYNLCTSGIQWCRFLSVLTASTMISLLNGPDDLLID
ncbi:hypothetical protein BC941DRAFT_511895 [Chlamydoabsidia padenii]|nr:hypothetical protein BC941DRAFT_511895 [Chlamydoabsidia padenii]